MSTFRKHLMSKSSSIITKYVKTSSNSVYTVPKNCVLIDLFLVGGGGGGAGHSNGAGRCGNGGNGGEVKYYSILDVPEVGSTFTISIGSGGSGGANCGVDLNNDTTEGSNGGNTTCSINGISYIAKGGSGGYDTYKTYDLCPDGMTWVEYQAVLQPNGNLGGRGCVWGALGSPGNDGTSCSFLGTSSKYGASGAGGSDCFSITSNLVLGGTTGGGNGGYGSNNADTNTGSDATFYGGGGGGGGFNSTHESGAGGDGYPGFAAVCFYIMSKPKYYRNKSWVLIATAQTSGDYRKLVHTVYPDKKVYAIATTAEQTHRVLWCSWINFYEDPINVNNYSQQYNCNNTYLQKTFDSLLVTGKKVLGIQSSDAYGNNSKRAIRYYYYNSDDIISKLALINYATYTKIHTNNGIKEAFVYKFELPMYLFQVQAAIDVENWYILVDNESLEDSRGKFQNWV